MQQRAMIFYIGLPVTTLTPTKLAACSLAARPSQTAILVSNLHEPLHATAAAAPARTNRLKRERLHQALPRSQLS